MDFALMVEAMSMDLVGSGFDAAINGVKLIAFMVILVRWHLHAFE